MRDFISNGTKAIISTSDGNHHIGYIEDISAVNIIAIRIANNRIRYIFLMHVVSFEEFHEDALSK